jgi:phage baseplate assembly protein gpV
MSGIVDSMRKVAQAEVKKLHLSELGVVTSVFPHSEDGDNDNYECSVKLRDRDIELRKVPVATSQVGLVSPPHVGDLVLLAFVNGDFNSPIVIGRLYNDEDRPPTSESEEVVYKPPYDKNAELRRVHLELPEGDVKLTVKDEELVLHVGETDVTISKEGVTLETKKPVTIKTEDDLSIKAKNIKLESDAGTEVTASGKLTLKGSTVEINP